MAEENGRVCAVCGKPLTGRQEFYCGMACAMRAQRKKVRGEQLDVERTRICQNCGKAFLLDGGRRKYCSDECEKEGNRKRHAKNKRAKKKNPVIICAWCGKEFVASHANTKYCSDECRLAARRGKYARKAGTITKICQNCGEEFVTDRKNRKYCSEECVQEQRKAQVLRHRSKKKAQEGDKTRHAQNKREEKKKPIIICAWCGKEFEGKSAKAKYCSKECRAAAEVERNRERRAAMRETPEGQAKLREYYVRARAKLQNQRTKICAMCGNAFEAKHNGMKYCSDECRKKATLIHSAQWYERKTETPEGREEVRERMKRYSVVRKAKPDYSEKYEAVLEQYKERYKLKKENGWTRKCAYCKKWFAGEKGVKYCSDECREAAEKEKEALMVGARTSDRICANCGKPLPEGRRQFCSDECRAAAAKLKRKKNKSKG